MKYRNHIHFKSGKEYLYIGEKNLVEVLQYGDLKDKTYKLDDGVLISGNAVEYIKTEEIDK